MIESEATAAAETAAPVPSAIPLASAPTVSMVDMLIVLTRNKWLIARAVGIAIIAGIGFSFIPREVFTATARIMTPQQTPSAATLLMSQLSSSGQGALASVAASGLSLKNPNDIYIGLLMSHPVADGIIQKFGLMQRYHAEDMTGARRSLADNTKIYGEKSGFIAIAVTDSDRRRAAEMANAYISELRASTKGLALSEASQRRLFYEEQLKRAKDELVKAEASLQEIQKEKGLVQLDAQAKAVIGALANLHSQIAAKEVELQAVRSYSTESNAAVQLLESELAALRAQAGQMQLHGRQADSIGMGLQDVAGSGIEYLSAEHEAQYRQIVFDLLLKQYDAAQLDEARSAAVIQVVEQASPPDRKSSPHRSSIVLIFAVLGLLGASLYVIGKAILNANESLRVQAFELRAALFSR
jgi:uncharacterized protein involved in exopolysaccharide biosynthesis